MTEKIIRTVCQFTTDRSARPFGRVNLAADLLAEQGYEIQTKRVCFGHNMSIKEAANRRPSEDYLLSVGTLSRQDAKWQFEDFLTHPNISFNLDLTDEVTFDDVDLAFNIFDRAPARTFNFTFVFNNAAGSPYFPSATYAQDGLAVGLQSTNLAAGCLNLQQWFNKQKQAWQELDTLLADQPNFLGIDSSVAPLFLGDSSLIEFVRRLKGSFSAAVTTDLFTQITHFLKTENPRPVGLCGLMFPCLEDFALAEEYEAGNFSIERNIFLSLHSGLGIDTYPIGIDEKPARVMEILKLVRALSLKYNKPLSVRFVSDGRAKVGQKSDFNNVYLQDVTIRPL